MNLFFIAITLLFVYLFSIGITSLFYQYSIKKNLIDIPNERSSHSNPTPRGGGVSIAFFIFISVLVTYFIELVSFQIVMAATGGVTIIALVGWVDDHKDIAFYWRFIFYSVASIWVLFWLGSLTQIRIGSSVLPLSYLSGYVVTFLGLVWITNLYNFMDGTDALAAVQAICASLLAGILLLNESSIGLALICFTILSSCAGFLFWNWPPAKIFMGDVGSCVLGFIFAVLAIASDKMDMVSVSVWCILLSVFICDATFTLLKRIVCREKWYKAHRSHSYQKLVQMGISHKKLALITIFINVFFIWPMAYLAHTLQTHAVTIAITDIIIMFITWGLIQLRYHREYEANVIN